MTDSMPTRSYIVAFIIKMIKKLLNMVMVAHLYNNELSLKIDNWSNDSLKKKKLLYSFVLFFHICLTINLIIFRTQRHLT